MLPAYLSGDPEVHGEFPFTLTIHLLSGHVIPHTHNFIEYTFAFHGRGLERINGMERELVPGTLSILYPHQVHEILIPPGEELHLYVGAIGLTALFREEHSMQHVSEILSRAEKDLVTSYRLADRASKEVHGLLDSMYGELQTRGLWSEAMFLARLTACMILLDRQRIENSEGQASFQLATPGKGDVREVIQYVYRNFRDPLTLDELGRRFGLSVPYISTAFKQILGINYQKFLENLRFSHACSLLNTTELPVTEIAFEVGFQSYATFHRVFLQRMGMSPRDYRKLRGLGSMEQST